MKIAISADGENLDSTIDQRFGRCKYFLIADVNKEGISDVTAVENQGALQSHGAGINAGRQLGGLKVEKVITGQLGPNAANILNQLGIEAYHASGNAKEAVEDLIKGGLEKITEAGEAHQNPMLVQSKQNSASVSSKPQRILFPLLNNKGLDSEVSEHFGSAPLFGVYDTESKKFEIIKSNIDHTDANKTPVDQITEITNPTFLFALGIGDKAIALFNEKEISIKTGSFKTVREVLDNINNLKTLGQGCGDANH